MLVVLRYGICHCITSRYNILYYDIVYCIAHAGTRVALVTTDSRRVHRSKCLFAVVGVVVVVVVVVVGCWLSVVGCWLLVVGCWLLVVVCWLLVVGCWLLVVGCRLLVVGCWLLVVGCWVCCRRRRCLIQTRLCAHL